MSKAILPDGGVKRFNYAPDPILSDFIRHAEKLDTHMVFETATEYLSTSELMQLSKVLEEIDRKGNEGRVRKRSISTHKLNMTRTNMRNLVVKYTKDRIPQKRISEHMGISVSTVKRLLSESRLEGHE